MADPLVWLVILIAAPVGSLLAHLAERSCARRNDKAGPACGTCGARPAFTDRVPLLSWIRYRRGCRGCGAATPFRPVAAEILALAAGFLAIAVTRDHADLAAAAIFLWCLLGLALTDLTCLRLPDPLTGALLIAGLALAWAEARLPAALLGAAIGPAVLWTLRRGYWLLRGREGLGLGDVKLAAGLGAGLGAAALPALALVASLSGLVVAALGVWGPFGRDTALPFGVFLCAGAALLLAARLVA